MINIKTYSDWNCDLWDYLTVGDTIDCDLYTYCSEELNCVTNTASVLQLLDNCKVQGNTKVFHTFRKNGESWIYEGYEPLLPFIVKEKVM